MSTAPERILAIDALSRAGDVLSRHAPGKTLVLACDDNTWAAAGLQFQQMLGNAFTVTPYSFGRDVYPTLERSETLAHAAASADMLVAVGSGTVNDLTKYAAAQLNKPYAVVATAASMNGYTSTNASLEEEGFKHSFAAKPPVAVIADISVIAAAPRRLARAGLGDTLCRSTVEADMLLSHYVRGTEYPKAIFDKLRSHEHGLINGINGIRDHKPAEIELLMQALLDGGDAMTAYGSSAVASQGEHMIAHTLELIYGAEIHNFTHGEIIAVATLTMANLQQRMMRMPFNVRAVPRDASMFHRLFGKALAPSFIETYAKKILSDAEVNHANTTLENNWDAIKQSINDILIAPTTLERVFKLIGLPTSAPDIQIEPVRYDNAVSHAYLTRDRFTFLDLAVMNDKRAGN